MKPLGHMGYSAPKRYITFKKVKDRKIFIRDCVCLRVAMSMIQTSLMSKHTDESLKTLHENKQRKQIAKCQSYLDTLNSFQADIISKLTDKDIDAIKGLSERFFKEMLSIILERQAHGVSLIHIAFYMIEEKFKHDNLHKDLKVFTKAWGTKRVVRLFEENGIYSSGLEQNVACDLALALKKI